MLSELKYMLIAGGKISSTLPTEISSLTNLEKLDVADNNLHGVVPDIPWGSLERLSKFLSNAITTPKQNEYEDLNHSVRM
mmetsp:Transcript_43417/g.104917  ORF Transcript_43417/g.104917 Transcript_43417/m.104917 type:complete len:80 (-) Transcript_43417:463-702(-)